MIWKNSQEFNETGSYETSEKEKNIERSKNVKIRGKERKKEKSELNKSESLLVQTDSTSESMSKSSGYRLSSFWNQFSLK